MKTPAVIIIILFIAWCFGCTYWYVCKIKGLCPEESNQVVSVSSEKTIVKKGNLLFSTNVTNPETNSETTELFDSLKNLTLDTLIIEGIYFKNETKQMALDRADKVKKLLLASNFDKPFKLKSLFKDKSSSEKFKAINFIPLTKVSGNQKEEEEDFKIETKNEVIIIYFPVASADPHSNKTLINTLKKLATDIKASGATLEITGHTDNSGTHEINLKYGQLRANAIKSVLVEYGVQSNKINPLSKGEEEPIASNNNEDGKRKNRRVEIKKITK